ncbi:hypothetical protein AVEN_1375-1 [Araneus ventricosus]|uniref:Uncharacterized protein n=1 Tax=Araneus ventricosus TaxID=182803 RepID=A0A4Y2SIA2_ARAVE|nr:hypothetical protein AVEN_1375-1 [Araneus ventricosus]
MSRPYKIWHYVLQTDMHDGCFAGPNGPGGPGGAGPGTGSTEGEGLVRVDLEVSVGCAPGGGPGGAGPGVKKTTVIYLNLY